MTLYSFLSFPLPSLDLLCLERAFTQSFDYSEEFKNMASSNLSNSHTKKLSFTTLDGLFIDIISLDLQYNTNSLLFTGNGLAQLV